MLPDPQILPPLGTLWNFIKYLLKIKIRGVAKIQKVGTHGLCCLLKEQVRQRRAVGSEVSLSPSDALAEGGVKGNTRVRAHGEGECVMRSDTLFYTNTTMAKRPCMLYGNLNKARADIPVCQPCFGSPSMYSV